MVEFVIQYQGLIGSFFAFLLSIFFWVVTGYFDRQRIKKNNEKEISNIFFMAARESENALVNIQLFLTKAELIFEKMENEIHLVIPPKINRIYINEERLFVLKSNSDFIFSQQVDIATSAIKMINSYMTIFEEGSQILFDSSLRMFESGLITKEKCISDYKIDALKNISRTKKLLETDYLVGQRQLLRPVVIAKRHLRLVPPIIDEVLDRETSLVLEVLKVESK